MKFKFECPTCGQRISATDADVNTVGSCPACQGQFRVRAPAEVLGAASGIRAASAIRLANDAPPIPISAPAPRPAQGMPGWSILALFLCMLPIASIPVLAKTSLITGPIALPLLFAILALLCVAGLLIAHRAFQRNAGPGFGWVLPALGLIFGYLGAAYVLMFFILFMNLNIALPAPRRAFPAFSADPFPASPPPRP